MVSHLFCIAEYLKAFRRWQQVPGDGSALWALSLLLDTGEPDLLKLPPLPVQLAFLLPLNG